MTLSQQIISDLTASMKAQDAPRTSTLRMVKAAMMNRQIEKGSELDDDEMQKLLRSLVKQRRDSIEQYARGGRQDLVDAESRELVIIEEYLPKGISDAEIEAALRDIIRDKGFSASKDTGLAMKELMSAHKGRVDGKKAQEIARRLLP